MDDFDFNGPYLEYTQTQGYLTQCIIELQDRLTALEKRIAELEAKNA